MLSTSHLLCQRYRVCQRYRAAEASLTSDNWSGGAAGAQVTVADGQVPAVVITVTDLHEAGVRGRQRRSAIARTDLGYLEVLTE